MYVRVCVHENTFVCVFNYGTQSRSFFIFVFQCGDGRSWLGRGETILKDVEVK